MTSIREFNLSPKETTAQNDLLGSAYSSAQGSITTFLANADALQIWIELHGFIIQKT